MNKIIKKYFDINSQFLHQKQYLTIHDLFADIHDDWSYYYNYNPLSKNNYKIYSGVGIWLNLKKDTGAQIIGIIPGSPAYSKLLPDDVITTLDGDRLTKTEIIEKLCGEINTKVTLGVIRDNRSLNISLIRNIVDPSTVVSKYSDNVLYLYFTHFCGKTHKQLYTILNNIDYATIGIIIDVRCNIGGLVHDAVKIIEMFVEKNTSIGFIKDNSKEIHIKSNADRLVNLRVAVLVNKYTMSSAELFCLALKENNVAKFFGETTYGKSLIQSNYVCGNYKIVLTDSCFLSPQKNNIYKIGIQPDVFVDSSVSCPSLFASYNDDTFRFAKTYLIGTN